MRAWLSPIENSGLPPPPRRAMPLLPELMPNGSSGADCNPGRPGRFGAPPVFGGGGLGAAKPAFNESSENSTEFSLRAPVTFAS